MSLIAPGPQTIGQVLDTGFKLFRSAFRQVFPVTVGLALIGYLPMLFQTLVHSPQTTAITYSKFSFTVLFTFLWQVAFSSLVTVYLIYRLDDIAEQRRALTWQSALTRARTVWLRVIGASIYFSVAIGIGFVLLLIPGLYLSVALSFGILIIVIEGMGISAAMSASRKLVSGYWWRCFGILGIAAIVWFAVIASLGFIVGLLFSVSSFRPSVQQIGAGFQITSIVFNVLSAAFLYPLAIAIQLTTFRDLQLRKTGSDLAARIEQTL